MESRDWVEKLQLARLLALSVLRFQATPWLPESWSSNNVSIYSGKLSSPCRNAFLEKGPVSEAAPSYTASSMAANSTLFSLGVVLFELGYDAPLHSLRRDEDLKCGLDNPFTDYFTAQRLGKPVSKKYNMTYGTLVEKCWYCGFGAGFELDSPGLQSAVVVGVVRELEKRLKAQEEFNQMLAGSA